MVTEIRTLLIRTDSVLGQMFRQVSSSSDSDRNGRSRKRRCAEEFPLSARVRPSPTEQSCHNTDMGDLPGHYVVMEHRFTASGRVGVLCGYKPSPVAGCVAAWCFESLPATAVWEQVLQTVGSLLGSRNNTVAGVTISESEQTQRRVVMPDRFREAANCTFLADQLPRHVIPLFGQFRYSFQPPPERPDSRVASTCEIPPQACARRPAADRNDTREKRSNSADRPHLTVSGRRNLTYVKGDHKADVSVTYE
ncbi:hypothetical protein Bbelb_068280 [Branchiostoma belcheri]|nr:hypothetical protein Bbelb_068280 [Branchiostoma belcheri]